MVILFNGSFIIIKIYLPKINDYELNFILNMFINFFQNFLSFGIIPLLFKKFGLIENKRKSKKSFDSNNFNKDDQVILFRTSIFKEEKEKADDGFVVLDKEQKKIENIEENDKNKNIEKEEIKLNQSEELEEDEFIYDINKEEKEELYGNSNLIENVQNMEEEEEEYLYLEGIEEENNKA